jgi:hypothetical protein
MPIVSDSLRNSRAGSRTTYHHGADVNVLLGRRAAMVSTQSQHRSRNKWRIDTTSCARANESVCRKSVGRCVCGVLLLPARLRYFENILVQPLDEGRDSLQPGCPGIFLKCEPLMLELLQSRAASDTSLTRQSRNLLPVAFRSVVSTPSFFLSRATGR